jgi:hypothetical protein
VPRPLIATGGMTWVVLTLGSLWKGRTSCRVCQGREAQTWETRAARFQPYTQCFSSLIANATRFPIPPKHKPH